MMTQSIPLCDSPSVLQENFADIVQRKLDIEKKYRFIMTACWKLKNVTQTDRVQSSSAWNTLAPFR